MSQRKLKKALMAYRHIKTKKFVALFTVGYGLRKKKIYGWVSAIRDYKICLSTGKVSNGR